MQVVQNSRLSAVAFGGVGANTVYVRVCALVCPRSISFPMAAWVLRAPESNALRQHHLEVGVSVPLPPEEQREASMEFQRLPRV